MIMNHNHIIYNKYSGLNPSTCDDITCDNDGEFCTEDDLAGAQC